MVDEPGKGVFYGGDVAAPVFSQVVQNTLRMMDVRARPRRARRRSSASRSPAEQRASDMPLTRLKSPEAAARWLSSWVTGTLRTDSRRVQPGDAFIAWPGYANDGRRFVAAGAGRGRVPPVWSRPRASTAFGFDDARIAALPGLKAATGGIAHAYFGAAERSAAGRGHHRHQRQDQHRVVDGAGADAAGPALRRDRHAGHRRAAVAAPRRGAIEHTGLTTPDPVTLHAAFRRFVDQGFAACAIEASSIGIVEHRLARRAIDVALFTNFTRTTSTTTATWTPTGRPSARCSPGRGCVPRWSTSTTSRARRWPPNCSGARRLDRLAAARRAAARRRRCATSTAAWPSSCFEDGAVAQVRSTLIGDYNVHNLLVVLAGLRALGVPLADAAAVVPQLTPVPGRMQRLGAAAGAGPEVVVDYAHTPDALEKVLQALRPLAAARGGRLWCVFGCGGNRDATKRPLMGAIAERGADRVVLTSDNPRDEAPDFILAQILAGVPGHDDVAVIEDRRAAIAHAVLSAAPHDVVLLAGKGHEDYQEVRGQRLPFSDEAEARAALASGGPHADACSKPRPCCPAPRWWAAATSCSSACTATRARCARATCSWRCAASASTRTTSCRRHAPPAPWRRWPNAGWAKPRCPACWCRRRCRRCRRWRRSGARAARCRWWR